ncbi:MAG: PAS domain-containing protein [Sulfuricurvum sp.]|nr:PAS domain-containing protein [Sulfuricurvum sp.]
MENKEYAITMKEAKFDINELFFSVTDHASTILSGNEVFVRISGYKKEELIGQFHNIIRHPDMPRIVFKTFWDYIKADKPIVAYVKNKTKEGAYYWVLAAVFPLNGQYVSIRIKPVSPIFSVVRELYFKLLMSENNEGIEGRDKHFSELLKVAGYDNYNQFMSNALLSELTERKTLMQSREVHNVELMDGSTPLKLRLQAVHGYAQSLMSLYDKWFDKINMFSNVKLMFEEKGVLLRHLARDIVFLSLNASVASYKVESGGETFGVLASDIRINAKENDTLIEAIHAKSQLLSETLNEIIFVVSAIRIQIEMVAYFIDETLHQTNGIFMDELGNNLGILITLVTEYGKKLTELQIKTDLYINENLKYLAQLERQVMYLGYIQVYGIIESASNDSSSMGFAGIFAQLKNLIETTSQEVISMEKMGENYNSENRSLMNESRGISAILEQLHEELSMIKMMKE